MRLKQAVTAVLMLTLSAAASASNWQQITQTSDGDLLIDRDSIVRDGRIVKVWLMQYHVTGKGAPYLVEPFYSEKHQWLLNCTGRSISVAQSIFMGKNGNVVYRDTAPTAYSDAAPDSLGDIVLTQVCKLF